MDCAFERSRPRLGDGRVRGTEPFLDVLRQIEETSLADGYTTRVDNRSQPFRNKPIAPMNDVKVAILDAAEKRIRTAGFNGFSFREIADDVGVKSSSVHYHFRTKIDLAAAVIHRYTGRIAELFDRELKTESDIAKICTKAFRGTLHSAGHMCPSTVLGAGSLDLPEPVAAEVRAYFQMCLEKMGYP